MIEARLLSLHLHKTNKKSFKQNTNFDIVTRTLKREKCRKITSQFTGIDKDFLNKIPAIQEIRPMTNKCTDS